MTEKNDQDSISYHLDKLKESIEWMKEDAEKIDNRELHIAFGHVLLALADYSGIRANFFRKDMEESIERLKKKHSGFPSQSSH